ncbi:hypothetical protein A2U01_0088437, partial [Trifolium medium]|nr:hypothetical protein [Trifolium medium]
MRPGASLPYKALKGVIPALV